MQTSLIELKVMEERVNRYAQACFIVPLCLSRHTAKPLNIILLGVQADSPTEGKAQIQMEIVTVEDIIIG